MQALVRLFLLDANTSDAQIVDLEDEGDPKVVKDYLHCLKRSPGRCKVYLFMLFNLLALGLIRLRCFPKLLKPCCPNARMRLHSS